MKTSFESPVLFTMSSDDVLLNSMYCTKVFFSVFLIRNPYPGELINHPDGQNVYTGVPKDYTGDVSIPKLLM